MKILRLLAATLPLLLSGFLSTAAFGATPARPNVLFILCDDLRPEAVGAYGSAHVKTPHIDALARSGV